MTQFLVIFITLPLIFCTYLWTKSMAERMKIEDEINKLQMDKAIMNAKTVLAELEAMEAGLRALGL